MINIKFRTTKDFIGVIPEPQPANKFVPKWYKEMSVSQEKNKPPVFSEFGILSSTKSLKTCIPVRDYITSGYIIPLYTDLAVDKNEKEDRLNFNWGSLDFDPITYHYKKQIEGSHVEKHTIGGRLYKVNNPWRIQTPKGYSCLFLPVQYREESFFDILPAIVDTDGNHEINFPFVFTGKDGHYTVHRGSPLVQVIPFKRDNWKMELSEWTEREEEKNELLHGTFLYQLYLKMFHKKKIYR
jgi:hypothetical protein